MPTVPATPRLSGSNTLLVWFGLFGILILGTFGCRSARDNQIDLLERELRTQEDYIYELEDYVLEYSEKLRQMRCVEPYQIVTQEKSREPELMPSKRATKRPVEKPSAPLPEPEPPEPEPEFDEPEALLPEELDIPDLEFETDEPVGQLEELREDSLVEAAFLGDSDSDDALIFYHDDAVERASTADESFRGDPEYDSEAEFLEELFEEESPDLGTRDAERLMIVGAYRGDPSQANSLRPGPTRLLTVIEARDANDEPVDLDGKISLMIMTADPVSPRRLKRWDFSAEETASAWQSSPLGDGLHLELPLEETIESEEPLELWVRLVGADGRKLLAQLPLEWEQLVSVEAAMEAQPFSSSDDLNLAENDARPLEQQTLAAQPLVKKRPQEAGPRWRTSLQRTHTSADGYATTARAAQGWTSQPTGGREPLVRSATARQSVIPATASASLRKKSTQEKRPQWSPPVEGWRR
ncbi:MAG: hypothetical protein GXP28_04980 [Planctomycetes bacterium]|nr:hypothetical protein [Planctomycetota bacterium]